MKAYEEIKVNKDDWWKYPDSFLKVIMNTGETQQITREDINSDILESLVPGWERQRRCPDDPLVTYIEVPRFADHVIHAAWSDVPGFGIDSHCYGYFASQHEILHDWTWELTEHDYLELTDKIGMQWHKPEKPKSKPFLAVIRLTGDQLTAANAPMPEPDWLADAESAIGFLLMKTFSEWLGG